MNNLTQFQPQLSWSLYKRNRSEDLSNKSNTVNYDTMYDMSKNATTIILVTNNISVIAELLRTRFRQGQLDWLHLSLAK